MIIKVIILAAGIGSRLGENIPKALVKIDEDKTILDLQLENLKQFIKIEDITLVVGFKKDLIIKNYPDISFIYNKDYLNTNTSKSLLIALKELKGHDILWLNGDVVFNPEILKFIMQNTDKNLTCVNNSQVGEEEVKYSIDEKGYIKEISKIVENALGESVGINFVKKEDVDLLISTLQECENTDYFERAIELAIEKGVKFSPLNIKDNFCIEVDFQEDLKEAKNYIGKGK